ncbi:MAG: glycosyltransferase [Candidatus Sumerlaeia bacterium]|nr:glycosyltransferase [Candidatus Sumerlaeia bacterium]
MALSCHHLPCHHLVVDARTVRPGATGVGHSVAGLLLGLERVLACDATWRVTALRLASPDRGSGWPADLWAALTRVAVCEVSADYEHHPAGDVWLHRELPRVMRRVEGDVLLSPAFLAPAGRRAFARLVVVPDAIAWDEPDNLPFGFRHYLRAATRLAAWGADRVLTLSPDAARRLARRGVRCAGLLPPGIDPTLFRPHVDGETVLPDGTCKGGPVVLYTAAPEARKNHVVLFEAMRRPELARLDPELVLLDRRAGEGMARWSRLTSGLRVRAVAPRGPADVAAWTRAADAVAFPSRAEGFGIPVVEAMACGRPVVASDIGVLRWLTAGGRAAHLVAPSDPAAWAQALASALEAPDDARRRAGLARARRFTVDAAARRLLAHASDVLARRG